jgi:formylglycine-generating enzyme required for sulfatase activity
MQKHHLAIALIAAAAVGGFYGWWRGKAPVAGAVEVSRCALPPATAAHPGMVWVPGGQFTLGSDTGFPEEGPAVQAKVTGFWMDQTEVTNAQFAQFVAATGYRTLAETAAIGGSAVFRPRGDAAAMRAFVNWWRFVPGANWRHPGGAGSLAGMDQHPVVHIAYEDALAYARWKGRGLPTEEQFEFAASSSARKNAVGGWAANTWQGSFPALNTTADGFAATAPVGCFEANKLGLYDLIGNVWEWTTSFYYPRHAFAAQAAHPQGFDPTQPEEAAVAVLKGGSYLCSPDYCMRYRPEARIGQSRGLGTSHIGFRTVLNP